MATSGSIALTFTRDEIIQEAYEQLQVVEPGVAATAAQVTSAARSLNNMIKAWQVQGLQIHSVHQSFLFTTNDQREYTLDGSSEKWVVAYDDTTLSTAGSATDLAIIVTSLGDIVNGDVIGIYQSDGTMHWTTVDGPTAGLAVPITDALTADTLVGATVYSYTASTDLAERPMEVVECWERNYSGNDRPIDMVSRQEYSELTLKGNTGGLVSAFYDPQVGSSNKLYIWPATEDVRNIIGTWVKRTFESFTAAADEVDLPQEAFEAVAYNLAKRLISKSAAKQMTVQYVLAMAQSTEEDLMNKMAGPEDSVFFQPDMDGYR